jgi:hypothetical protein
MPIQTDRQHVTHRIATHNGMSGRYRTMPFEWLNTPKDIKDITNKLDRDIAQLKTKANKIKKDVTNINNIQTKLRDLGLIKGSIVSLNLIIAELKKRWVYDDFFRKIGTVSRLQ